MLEPSSSEDEGDEGPIPSAHPASSYTANSNLRRKLSREEDLSVIHHHFHQHPVASGGPKEQFNATSSSTASSTAQYQTRHRTTSPSQEPSTLASQHGSNDRLQAIGSSTSSGGRPGSSCNRPVSPTPSMTSDSKESSKWDNDSDRADREESERKTRLQLYVFVIRCISYPFNAKQPNDISRRNLRISRSQLEQIQSRVSSYVKDEAPKPGVEDHFHSTVQLFYDFVLSTDRLLLLVKGGGCSLHDLKEIFRLETKKKVKTLPEPDGNTREGLINSWMGKFECLIRGDDDLKSTKGPRFQITLPPDTILTKDQLYDMFQGVLAIKKFEHQLLFKYELRDLSLFSRHQSFI